MINNVMPWVDPSLAKAFEDEKDTYKDSLGRVIEISNKAAAKRVDSLDLDGKEDLGITHRTLNHQDHTERKDQDLGQRMTDKG